MCEYFCDKCNAHLYMHKFDLVSALEVMTCMRLDDATLTNSQAMFPRLESAFSW